MLFKLFSLILSLLRTHSFTFSNFSFDGAGRCNLPTLFPLQNRAGFFFFVIFNYILIICKRLHDIATILNSNSPHISRKVNMLLVLHGRHIGTGAS